MFIAQGYAAIAVVFDYWGLAGLVSDTMKKGKEIVKQVVEAESNATETP